MTTFDRLALSASVGIAALMRIPGIDARGRFDADQGHDMLTLLRLTQGGIVPLLGPEDVRRRVPSRCLLLLPACAIGGDLECRPGRGHGASWRCWGSPRSRSRGGSGARSAVLLRARSPACSSPSRRPRSRNRSSSGTPTRSGSSRSSPSRRRGARARAVVGRGGRSRLRRRGRWCSSTCWGSSSSWRFSPSCSSSCAGTGPCGAPLLAGLGVVALLFLPLLAHELGSGSPRRRRSLAYLHGGDEPIAAEPASWRSLFTLLRVDRLAARRARDGRARRRGHPARGHAGLRRAGAAPRAAAAPERHAVAARRSWPGASLALAFAAPSLQRVVAGPPERPLPRVPRPGGRCCSWPSRSGSCSSGRLRPGVEPPAHPGARCRARSASRSSRSYDRSCASRRPSTRTAAGRRCAPPASAIVASGTARRSPSSGLPTFKLTEAIGFPIVHAGGQVPRSDLTASRRRRTVVVLVCDRLFEAAIGRRVAGRPRTPFVDFRCSAGGAFEGRRRAASSGSTPRLGRRYRSTAP